MDKQKTINKIVSLEGIGLHTGQKSRIELRPANPDTGIIFVRQDIAGSPIIKADINCLVPSEKFPRRTAIGSTEVYIQTIEHLMAALSVLGIDNLQVNVWAEEIPGLDGSAKDFIEKIKEAGVREQDANRKYIVIKEPIWVEEGTSNMIFLPYPTLRVSYALQYENPVIGSSFVDLIFDNNSLKDNFYSARTFCLQEEANLLLDMGLGKGSNYQNTLVVSETGVIDNKLRMDNEFAKHKVLDLIGDLYLSGPIKGYIIAVKSGHSLTLRLLQRLERLRQKSQGAGIPSAGQSIDESDGLGVEQIMKILPHRYPFLLVDKIIHLEKGKRAIGIKNITINEHFFQGHFPGRPVMPGVLLIEAMAQVGGVVMLACEEHRGKLAFFMAADAIKFRKTVVPGDQLRIEIEVGKVRSKSGSVAAKAYVGDKLAAEAKLIFALVD